MDFKDLDDISTASADGAAAADTNTTKIKDGAPQNYNSNSDSEEEQEYVSAYSKFTNKNLSNTTTTTTKQPRRRRGGYGTNNTTSMLETLPENNDGAPNTTSNFNDLKNNNETAQPSPNSNNNAGLPKDDDFGLNMNDFMSQDFGGVGTQHTDIFMNSDEDDEDDDDATRPLDSNEMSDLEKIGPWTGDVESDVDTAATTTGGDSNNEGEDMSLEEDIKPKGRTKQSKKKKSVLESDDLGIESEVKEGDIGEEAPQEEDNTEDNTMEVDKSEFKDAPSDELVVESNTDAPSQEEETESPKKPSTSATDPSNSDLLSLVDKLFTAADKDTMTVGGVNRSVATHFGWEKVDKTRKKVIKNRLMDLMNGIVSVGEGLDGEETKKKKKKKKSSQKKKEKKSKTKSDDENMEENADNVDFEGDYESEEEPEPVDADKSSDYEEEAPTPKKRSGKKNKKKVSYSSDSDDSIDAPTKKKRERRSSSKKSGKGKMAKHLRDHHAKARQRQMEEARIRKEELGHLADDDDEANLAKKDKVSEEDRQRHAEIQARFNTTSEELIIKRREDRVGLIDRLRMARLEQLEENLTLSEMAKDVKKEEINVDVKVEDGQPKLTSTNVKVEEKEENEEEEAVNAAASKKSKMLTLGDDTSSEEESEDDDDDDLEIVAPSTNKPPVDTPKNDIKSQIKAKNTSAMDFLFNPGKKVASKSSKPVANPRLALRNALRAQKMYASNRWLATQLEYRDEDKHIKDCLEAVTQKNKQILMMEKKAVAREKEAALRSEQAFGEEMPMNESNDTEKEFDEEEDEEMAVARELEQLENGADVEQDDSDENSQADDPGKEQTGETADESQANKPDMDSEEKIPDTDPATDDVEPAEMEESSEDAEPSMVVTPAKVNTDVVTSENADDEKSATELVDNTSSEDKDTSKEIAASLESNKADENSTEMESEELKETDTDAHTDTKSSSNDKDATEEASPAEEESEGEEEESTVEKPKKPKNSAWQAMLLKEKASIAKEKKRQRKNGGLVEGEAEEEEEEEGIVGLEDFGFAVSKKKDDEEDVDAEIDEDDLEHVVDDLSDGEGDEEAGEKARKRMQKQEEKERHQEMIRRMRDGFDGRRGGIATSAGARGTLRFDQLVAADGREGAKKLGLANDDEFDSDDEDGEKKEKKDDDEEEDETAMLDQMIRERHLGKQDEALEENFTDEEESDDEDEEEEKNTKGADDDDADDRVQDRLAKHFDKRARRNRMLEEYGKEEEDETKRLYEEDNFCLKTIKTSFSHSRSVEASNLGSNLGVAKENNFASKKRKTSDNKTTDDAKPATSFLAQGGSLSIALMASRSISRKRKAATTFKSGKQVKGFSRSNSSSSSSRSVSLNHVVFMSESSSQAFDSNSRSHSFMGTSTKSAPKSKASRGSLWSRINKK